jgi:hypothetical protein
MPFYVSPEQAMKDKADYARKGIARGRNSVVLQYDEGILFVAPNPSGALHKISEIYDRIAFAAVGRYNEYENLRVAGVRYADTRGYQYDRADVTARGLANWYAQILGTIFTETPKSMSRNGLLRMAFGLTVANCSLMLMNEFRLRSVLRYRFPSHSVYEKGDGGRLRRKSRSSSYS